jgi:Cytochrome oxidase complex assembly protein 1
MKKNFLKRRRALAAVAVCAVTVIGLGLLWVWRFERNARAPIGVAMDVARSSARLQKAIGTPMRAEQLARGNLVGSGGFGTADLMVRIAGPNGRGTLSEWAQESAGEWHVCSLSFHPRDGGQDLTLVDDATTHCERE